VSNGAGIVGTARAQPLADLPIEPLLGRGETLARMWATALVLSRPLDRIGELPLEELALRGPHACVGVLRALRSNGELGALADAEREAGLGGAASLAAMSGATDAASAADAVELLRGVLWEALAGELLSGRVEIRSPRRLADASDRLAYVCSTLLTACLAGALEQPAGLGAGAAEIGVSRPGGGLRTPGARTVARHGAAAIVDERGATAGIAIPSSHERRPAHGGEIEIHDRRRPERPEGWIGSIVGQLELFRVDGRPFAVLLLELSGRAGRERELPAAIAAGLEADVEALLATALGGAGMAEGPGSGAVRGSLARERPGRYWLLVPDTDRAGARELAQRLTRAVSRLIGAAGATGPPAVGAASCPQDGTEATALAAHAEVDLCAARSAAREEALAEREAVGHRPSARGPAS
jgi:hypothetical protein